MMTSKLHMQSLKTLVTHKMWINRIDKRQLWSKSSSQISVLSSQKIFDSSVSFSSEKCISSSSQDANCSFHNISKQTLLTDKKIENKLSESKICGFTDVEMKGVCSSWNVLGKQDGVLEMNNRNQSCPSIQAHRNFSTGMEHLRFASKGPSLLTRMLWKVGIGNLRYNKTRMRIAAYKLYMCCDELVDHIEIAQVLGLPDTFYSWYLSMELHVWLIMVRLQQEGDEGKYVKHMLVRALWDDVENRSKKLGHAAQTSARKIGIKEIGDHFQAALFAYDEGALGDDKVLGAAIWRIVFEMGDVDPVLIELLVAYVRKQLLHLDGQKSENLLKIGQVNFLQLYGEDLIENKEKLQQILARST